MTKGLKIKVTNGETTDDGIPPMPGARDSDPGSDSQSTFSGTTSSEPAAVDEALAADLIGLPYEIWAAFEPEEIQEYIKLREQEKAILGGPVARILTKYGLGSIAKDEILVVSVLSLHTFGAVKAIRKAKKDAIDEGKTIKDS